MTFTGDLRRDLLSDEPDYPILAAQYGRHALGTLRQIVQEGDVRIAPKAVYLASLIEGPLAAEIVALGTSSDSALLKAAAAGAIANLQPKAALPLVDRLLDDADIGVRGRAAKSLASLRSPEVTDRLRRVAAQDSSEQVRAIAESALEDLNDR